MFDKILIANRGEIACRIMKTARRLGIQTVAVYSDPDENAKHVRTADEAYRIGKAESSDSYLNIPSILEAAREAGAEAIHPGYGFLAENPKFPEACEEADIKFIGPSGETIEAMGRKDQAKQIMEEAGVPVVPGYRGENQDSEFLQKQANEIGYPVLIKALAGGGGKGMRKVESEDDFLEDLESCRREAESSFGDDRVLLEKYIEKPRHIEVQVFGDNHGNALHLFERDCSVQRRYQKVVEEAPAPGVDTTFREKIGEAAVRAVEALDYTNAGTMEFIVDAAGGINPDDFYFMEMNTRLQVEHPVTEMITGQDLVEWQIRVAAGEELPRDPSDLSIDGHAFEVRIYAEDPSREFLPQTGKINRFVTPVADENVRLDSGVDDGDSVGIHYDPLIGKLIVHGQDRNQALQKMHEALLHTGIAGLTTNLEFLYRVFEHPAFQNGGVDTGFVSTFRNELIPSDYGEPSQTDLALASVYFLAGLAETPKHSSTLPHDPWSQNDNWRLNSNLSTSLKLISNENEYEVNATCSDRSFELTVKDESFNVRLQEFKNEFLTIKKEGANVEARVVQRAEAKDITLFHNGRSIPFHLFIPGVESEDLGGEDKVMASMPGKIIEVYIHEGDEVEKHEPVLVMEAMKMEMTVEAGRAGVVDNLPVAVDDQVQEGDLLVSIS